MIEHQSKQINNLKNYIKITEDRNKKYEEEIRERNEKINALIGELTDKQNFINNYLKKL